MTDPARHPCCTTWDENPLVTENGMMHARLDAHPLRPGHTLIIARRHVTVWEDLTDFEVIDLHQLLRRVCHRHRERHSGTGFTVAVNDGPAAGQSIAHFHMHVIPIDPADRLTPGGVRRLFIPDPADDTWKREQP